MIPHFSNPHFLSQSTKVITRAELDAEDEEKLKDFPKENTKTIEQLHRLLDNSLPTWDVSDIRCSKRRKIEENDQVKDEPVLFRLVSSTLPALPVSLLPPPPPPSITREPEAEDNELQAGRRRKQAEAAAISVEDIHRGIGSTQVLDVKRKLILSAVASIPDPEPHLMIVQRRQASGKMLPPVGPPKLLHHLYISCASTESPPLNTSSAKCPSVEAHFGLPESLPLKGRRRRKWKEVLGVNKRPPPQYYRPNPRWEGKCRGYGYGYPSSFAMTDDWKYERDTMRIIK